MFTGYHNISHMTMSFRVACKTGFCGRDCTTTPDNNPRIQSCLPNGDIVCTDRRFDPAVSCRDCLYNLDISTNCSTCLEPGFDPNTNCTARFSTKCANCTQCLPNCDSSIDCSSCLLDFDIKKECSVCLPGQNISTNYSTCLSGENCRPCEFNTTNHINTWKYDSATPQIPSQHSLWVWWEVLLEVWGQAW